MVLKTIRAINWIKWTSAYPKGKTAGGTALPFKERSTETEKLCNYLLLINWSFFLFWCFYSSNIDALINEAWVSRVFGLDYFTQMGSLGWGWTAYSWANNIFRYLNITILWGTTSSYTTKADLIMFGEDTLSIGHKSKLKRVSFGFLSQLTSFLCPKSSIQFKVYLLITYLSMLNSPWPQEVYPVCVCVCVCTHVCLCVCVREREREILKRIFRRGSRWWTQGTNRIKQFSQYKFCERKKETQTCFSVILYVTTYTFVIL